MPFPSLRQTHTHRLWTAATSTKWPGLSRSAPFLAILVVLLSLAHVAVGIYLVWNLGRVPDAFTCVDDDTGNVRKTITVVRPLTFLDDGTGKVMFSLARAEFKIISALLLTVIPLICTLAALALTYKHFRPRGPLSNQNAIRYGFLLLCLWWIGAFTTYFVKIDRDGIETEWHVCRTEDAARLWRQRRERMMMWAVRDWGIVAVTVCILLYLATAFYAAILNRRDANAQHARTEGLELQDLPPASGFPPTHSNPHTPSYERQNQNAWSMQNLPPPSYFSSQHVYASEPSARPADIPLPASPMPTGAGTPALRRAVTGPITEVAKGMGRKLTGRSRSVSSGKEKEGVQTLWENPFADDATEKGKEKEKVREKGDMLCMENPFADPDVYEKGKEKEKDAFVEINLSEPSPQEVTAGA